MNNNHDLESLYTEAQSALKAKDYNRATDLLRQILKADVDYKDAAQLLARVIKLSRHRWYNDPRLWGAIGVLFLVGLGIYLFPKFQEFTSKPAPTTPLAFPTSTPSPTVVPSATTTPTETPLPTPTPIPLTWKRISLGQEFPRDMVTAFATDRKDPDVIYAAMTNAGVYKTIDGGLSWHPAHEGLASAQVTSLLADSQNPRILYAATMDGIFKTEDGSENWFRISDGTDLLMDYQNTSHLYTHDENGIYETKDQGTDWTTVYALGKDCPDAIHSWAIHPTDGTMLFIGGGGKCTGVYQSKDGGDTWSQIGLQDKPSVDHLTIGLDKEGDFSIYINLSETVTGPERGMFVSHDGGANWSLIQHLWCDILNSDPDNPSTIYCAGGGLSIKRGTGSWRSIPGTNSIRYTAIYIDNFNGTERIITDGTNVSKGRDYSVDILVSTDSGTSWADRNIGIGSARSELKIDPKNSARIYLAAYYKGADDNCILFSSLDNGKNWSPLRAAGWCGPTFDAANAFYMMEWGALQMSSNGGKTWLWERREIQFQNRIVWDWVKPLPSYYQGGSESVSANPYFEGLVYDIGDAIYYLTGSGWQKGNGSEGLRDARLFYTEQSKLIYAIGRYHQAYSTDNGVTWQACGQDVVTASRSDTRLALDLQGTRLYLATPGQGVLASTDNCGSWQASNEGLSNLFVNTIAIDPNDSNKIYAGTNGGAYISFDGGQTWGQVNDGLLGATVVYSIAIDPESNVYAATPYGIFKLEGK